MYLLGIYFLFLKQDHQTLSLGGLLTLNPEPVVFNDFLNHLHLMVCPLMRAKEINFTMPTFPPEFAFTTAFVCSFVNI